MTIALGVLVLVGVLLWRRRRRAAVLAGRVADKPTYMIEPPHRRVGDRRRELL